MLPVTVYRSSLAVSTILFAAIVPETVSIAWFVLPLKPEPLFTAALAWFAIVSSNGKSISKTILLALLTIFSTTLSFTAFSMSSLVIIPAMLFILLVPEVSNVPSLKGCVGLPGWKQCWVNGDIKEYSLLSYLNLYANLTNSSSICLLFIVAS